MFRRGNRVMGWCMQGALANLFLADDDLLCRVPEQWTMEEAATVPFVYTTAIFALIAVSSPFPTVPHKIYCL